MKTAVPGGRAPLHRFVRTATRAAATLGTGLLCLQGARAGEPAPQPTIAVDRMAVDFGVAGWKERKVKTVTVRNVGGADLSVGFPFTTPAGEFMVVSPQTDFTLAPGAEQVITLDFVPIMLGQGSSELVLVSNDRVQPRLEIHLTGTGSYPVLEISPLTLNYGPVAAGESKDLSFTVRNVGTEPLTVGRMLMETNHFKGISPTRAYTLPPGGTQPVTVRFAPRTNGELTVQLSTESNAANNDEVIVTLTGFGLAPDVELDPPSLEFGEVTVGEFEEQPFRVRNVGNRPLTVQGIPSANDNFRAVNPPRPFELAPGASQVVTVRFTPCDLGPLSGDLQVQSNDPDEPKVYLLLSGGAGEAAETAIALNARDGEVVTWSDQAGNVIQRIRVWLDMSLRIVPHAVRVVGDRFESSRATVTGTMHVWGEATDTSRGEKLHFDDYFDLDLQGIPFTSEYDPIRGQVFRLAGRPTFLRPGPAKPYQFEYEGASGRLRLWVGLPAPWDYPEADEFYDLNGLACLPGRPPLEILAIDDLPTDNGIRHHTSEYWRYQRGLAAEKQLLVLRRAETFTVVVTLSRRLLSGQGLSLRWKDLTSGDDTKDIPMTAFLDPNAWSAQIDPADVSKPQMRVHINLPRNAAVGQYRFTARLQAGPDEPEPAPMDFPRKVVVVFNPWNDGDECWLPSRAQRDEYVSGKWGALYNLIPTKDFWFFDQFSTDCVEVCLWALKRMDAGKRASPAKVASHLCAMSNEEGDGGILVGLWGVGEDPKTFHEPGGKHPSEWTSSGEIFRAFLTGGHIPLRFAQCWVFAGVTTSLLRCAGIPARPVKGYHIGRDLNGDGKLDWVWKIEPKGAVRTLIRTILQENQGCSDFLWDWHVWCEAWMARPDLPGPLAPGDWQALDSSPQQVRTTCNRPTFEAGQLIDLASLASKLKQPGRLVDTWLAGQLSSATQAALASYQDQGFDPELLRTSLVVDLNGLVRKSSSFYEPQRFSGVDLRPETQALLSQNPQLHELERLNRLLLEDAYPLELARMRCCTTAGLFKQGPAPLRAVREHGSSRIEYEVDQVFTGVAGRITDYVQLDDGSLREAAEGETPRIKLASEIITKRAGWPIASPPEWITSNYRPVNGPRSLSTPGTAHTTSGIAIELNLPEAITVGEELTVIGRVQNQTGSKGAFRVVMNLVWVEYSGVDLAVERLLANTTVPLGPDDSVVVSDTLREIDYLASLKTSRRLEARLVAWELDQSQIALARTQVVVLDQAAAIELPPAWSTDIGEPSSCRITWTNPLSVPVENVALEVALGDDLAFTSDLSTNRTVVSFGTLPAGGVLEWAGNLVGRTSGQHPVHAFVTSDQLGLVRSTEILEVGPSINLVIELRSGNVELSFNTVQDERYRIEYAEDPALEAWHPFGDEVEGTGARVAFSDPSITTNRQRCYRVRVLGR